MKPDPAPTLAGTTVTLPYVADPLVGYGEFVLANPGPEAITAAVESLWFESSDQRRSLSPASLFAPEERRALDAHALSVEPGAVLTFQAGFPPFPYEPPFGASAAVGIRLRVGNAALEARSPLQFVRRWPQEAS